MKKIYTIFFLVATCCLFINGKLYAQNLSATIGTDIPYQHYLGATFETKYVDLSYRTGLLTSPYSDAAIVALEVFDVDQIYIDLTESAYQVGWMNSIGTYAKLGNKKRWYIGPEFRLDYLTAADTPVELLELVIGQSVKPSTNSGIGSGNILNKATDIEAKVNIKLGVILYAVGFRLGRSFSLDSDEKHLIRTEFSFAKHVETGNILE